MVRWFLHLPIRAKLLAAVGAVLVASTAIGLGSVLGLNRLNSRADTIAHQWLNGVDAVGTLSTLISDQRALQYRLIATTGDADRAQVRSALDAQRQRISAAQTAYTQTMTLDGERALMARIASPLATIDKAWPEVQQLAAQHRPADAQARMLETVEPAFAEVIPLVDSLRRFDRAEAQRAAEQAASIYSMTRWGILGALILCAAFGLAVAMGAGAIVGRDVALIKDRLDSLQRNCLAGLRSGLDALARGDLQVDVHPVTKPIGSDGGDEFGEISRALDSAIRHTQEAVNSYAGTKQALTSALDASRGLITAAQRGETSVRADASTHRGSFGDLVSGMNDVVAAAAGPLAEAQEVLGRVARRDLTARITGRYVGDYSTLSESINTAVGNVASTLAQVNAASEQVAAAGSEIAGASQSLASGASEQAAGIEEIASSAAEFASMARTTNANTQAARSLAERARQNATDGVGRMQRMTDAVQAIRRSSQETAKIVRTIEEIAFQTNLLALNAAVEAARAGDAGRGFAVVAEEVRGLAIRSAEASKSTADLIDQALQNAEHGVELNSAAAASFDAIRDDVTKVAEVMTEIATASAHQADGVAQINGAIDQLNGTTQQVASNAEETASTAEELSSQAAMLSGLVSQFQFDAATRGAPTASSFASARGAKGPSGRPRGAEPVRPARPAARPAAANQLIPFDDDPSAADDSETLSVF